MRLKAGYPIAQQLVFVTNNNNIFFKKDTIIFSYLFVRNYLHRDVRSF